MPERLLCPLTYRQHSLVLTEHSRAVAKVSLLVLLNLRERDRERERERINCGKILALITHNIYTDNIMPG